MHNGIMRTKGDLFICKPTRFKFVKLTVYLTKERKDFFQIPIRTLGIYLESDNEFDKVLFPSHGVGWVLKSWVTQEDPLE